MRRLQPGFSWPLFRRLPSDPLRLFKQALPVKPVCLSLWEDPALFFIDMVADQFLKDFKPRVKGGRPRPWSESIQLIQQEMYELVFFNGFVNDVDVLEGRAKGGIHDPFFDSRVDRQFANDPMGDLRFFSIAGLGILREQGTYELMIVAQ